MRGSGDDGRHAMRPLVVLSPHRLTASSPYPQPSPYPPAIENDLTGFETGADELFIVAGEDVLVREGGVRPGDAAPLAELAERGLDQLRPADLLVALRREP